MRSKYLVGVLGLGLLCSGCNIVRFGVTNPIVATGRVTNEWKARCSFKHQAERAWKDARRACPGQKFSNDYAKGFKYGFVDYIDGNGNGQPPMSPPYCYRTYHYESPAGHQAIEDWYAGYRHGSAVAAASGRREWWVVPLTEPARDRAHLLPSEEHAGPEAPPPGETLPMPEKVPPPVQQTAAWKSAPAKR